MENSCGLNYSPYKAFVSFLLNEMQLERVVLNFKEISIILHWLLSSSRLRFRLQDLHSQKKQLTPLQIIIWVSVELSLYSWIACLDDDIQWSELFLLRV